MSGPWGVIGAISGLIAVVSGAFGAHALRARVASGALTPRLAEVWQTAAEYQIYHALALVGVAWAAHHTAGHAATSVAGWSLVIGTLLFSGSLYAMTLTGARWLGAITPLGGVAFMIGWGALAWALWRGAA